MKMLKFYVVKREESGHSPAFAGIVEFEDLSDFIRWADYNRMYIQDIRTLEGEN
jgi:hypothetical protein